MDVVCLFINIYKCQNNKEQSTILLTWNCKTSMMIQRLFNVYPGWTVRCKFDPLLCYLSGISLKTQELYALVFATRYLDIFVTYISFYNTVMKLIFLGTSFSIVWYMRYHKTVRLSYDKNNDTFRHYFLILPCLALALLFNNRFTFREVCLLN